MKRYRAFKLIGDKSGFTLMEIVITLVVAFILAGFFAQFMGTSITESGKSVNALKESFSLNAVMDKMTADYKRLLGTDPDPLTTFKDRVQNGGNVANTPYYGQYAVIHNDYIVFDGSNTEAAAVSGSDILKVTIQSGPQTFTALFTE